MKVKCLISYVNHFCMFLSRENAPLFSSSQNQKPFLLRQSGRLTLTETPGLTGYLGLLLFLLILWPLKTPQEDLGRLLTAGGTAGGTGGTAATAGGAEHGAEHSHEEVGLGRGF